MTYGTPKMPLVNSIAMWFSIILQPWLVFVAWPAPTLVDEYFWSPIGEAIVSGLISGSILTYLSWIILRSRPKFLWAFVFMVSVATVLN